MEKKGPPVRWNFDYAPTVRPWRGDVSCVCHGHHVVCVCVCDEWGPLRCATCARPTCVVLCKYRIVGHAGQNVMLCSIRLHMVLCEQNKDRSYACQNYHIKNSAAYQSPRIASTRPTMIPNAPSAAVQLPKATAKTCSLQHGPSQRKKEGGAPPTTWDDQLGKPDPGVGGMGVCVWGWGEAIQTPPRGPG